MSEVTQILVRIQAGDREATRALLPLVYAELRQLAQSRLAQEAPGQTLQATALVHEAYLRLAGPDPDAPGWDHRGHFFAAAAEAMRRILIESARRRQSLKRGGGLVRQELDERVLAAPVPDDNLLALDEALVRLASVDPPAAQLVQLRFFGGLSLPQAAPVLGISLRSAERLWSYARAWLFDALQSGVPPD